MLDNPNAFLSKVQSQPPHGMTFRKLLGCGRSAAVFLADASDGQTMAVKIYDSRLLQKYGREVQAERLRRELSLCGHSCRDLVQIYDGGELVVEGEAYSFVSMEYVDGTDLRSRLNEVGRLPDGEIRKHLGSLLRASAFLESRGLCHRDTKADNCRLRPDQSLVLLDLGVMRPIEHSELTDVPNDPKSRYFLGTLRYASPEFLLRREQDSPDGWRAVTTYQIGTVLYEMIQGTLLFPHIREPYAELVQAVLYSPPELLRDDVGADLVTLTRCCLANNPLERLKLAPWVALQRAADAPSPPLQPSGRFDLMNRVRSAVDDYTRVVEIPAEEARRRAEMRSGSLQSAQRAVADGLELPALSEAEPEVKVLEHPDAIFASLRVPANLKLGFPYSLRLILRLSMDNTAFESVHVRGVGCYGEIPHMGTARVHGQGNEDAQLLRALYPPNGRASANPSGMNL
jgi:serine/threonine protein kinase